MERCPNCRARGDGGPACRRCGMDLALLQAVERAAERELRQAVARLAAGEPEAAARAARRALSLQRHPLAERVAGFVQAQQAGDRLD